MNPRYGWLLALARYIRAYPKKVPAEVADKIVYWLRAEGRNGRRIALRLPEVASEAQ
jgi:hypothetical protein